jgi:Holliday junction resolvase RusA-like endonuclease
MNKKILKKYGIEIPEKMVLTQNPEIDILFGHMNASIPSKKIDFKPIEVRAIDDEGNEEILRDFYVKKPSSQSVLKFENLIRQEILTTNLKDKKISKPALVEVMITLSLTKKDFFNIDVDNIAKTVLDSLTGYLFDDDSQVANLISQKHIHPLNMRGFLIAITELKQGRGGLLKDIYLYSMK